MIWVAAYVVFLCFAAIWCTKKPGIAIGLLICMYGIETFLQSQSTYIIDHSSYINISVGVITLIAVICSLLRKPFKVSQVDPVQLLSLAVFGFAFLSYFWTIAPEEFSRFKGELPYMLVFLILAPLLTREAGTLQDGFRWALAIGVPIMLLTAFYCEWGVRGVRLAKPIDTGRMIMEETLPLAIASMASILGIIALVIDLKKIPMKFGFRLAVLALSLYIAFLTESRGQVVAIIGVSAIVYPISNRATNVKGLFVTILGFLVFGAILYFLINSLDLVRWRQDRVESAMIGRQDMWVNLIYYWATSNGIELLIGMGVCSSFNIVGFYPHNLPIEILAEYGLIGFGLFVAIIIKSFSNSLKLLSRLESNRELRSTVVAVIGLIGVNFALCLKEGTLAGWSLLFFFGVCLSQQVVLTRNAKSTRLGFSSIFLAPPEDASKPAPSTASHPQAGEFTGR